MGWRFDNSYGRLPGALFAHVAPTPVKAPSLLLLNEALVGALGLSVVDLKTTQGLAWLAGNALPVGAEPLAQAYAGHQFGHFNILGDGRAILLGEHLTPAGERVDIQLKGSGRTPYSRRGDGRAALGPMLREYIISEAMHALGIPSTRSLAVVATGELVARERMLPGAVLTRVAASHLRVGTFEFAAAQGDDQLLATLVRYAWQRHVAPVASSTVTSVPEASTADLALALLHDVISRQARLLAAWQSVGFIHGVMNTDNMTISGETIDYGPCAFMDAYDPATVFSSIDHHGRYAYGEQPTIARWNLARFAETLLPLLHPEPARAITAAQDALDGFSAQFAAHWLATMQQKLGLAAGERDDGDGALIADLLAWMHAHKADFTGTFRALASAAAATGATDSPDASLAPWHARWAARLARQGLPPDTVARRMRASNPALIARNHVVEAALAAAHDGDLSVTHRLLAALARPFDEAPEFADLRVPAPATFAGYQTFCGT
ncbi:MAG: YdiU family protein [Myxococcales bacterium]|nr:YdiU family protein [Myxococcales bacterium]